MARLHAGLLVFCVVLSACSTSAFLLNLAKDAKLPTTKMCNHKFGKSESSAMEYIGSGANKVAYKTNVGNKDIVVKILRSAQKSFFSKFQESNKTLEKMARAIRMWIALVGDYADFPYIASYYGLCHEIALTNSDGRVAGGPGVIQEYAGNISLLDFLQRGYGLVADDFNLYNLYFGLVSFLEFLANKTPYEGGVYWTDYKEEHIMVRDGPSGIMPLAVDVDHMIKAFPPPRVNNAPAVCSIRLHKILSKTEILSHQCEVFGFGLSLLRMTKAGNNIATKVLAGTIKGDVLSSQLDQTAYRGLWPIMLKSLEPSLAKRYTIDQLYAAMKKLVDNTHRTRQTLADIIDKAKLL